MSEESVATRAAVLRQWVSVGNSSCDLRVGSGALDLLGSILKGSVGQPHLVALAVEPGTDEELATRMRHELTNVGFQVRPVSVEVGVAARSLEACARVAEQLAGAGITSDDLICCVGGVDTISALASLSGVWCGGTPLAAIATTLDAAVECTATPRGLDVAGIPEMIAVRPACKYLICDLDVVDCDPSAPEARLMRALMATSALADNEKAVERLWDRAELLASGDVEALAAQIADTAKTRGRIASATAVALRQSIGFGWTFARALAGLLGGEADMGRLLAEGVRFQARLSAGQELLAIDDVLTMDELLDMLELEPITCEVEPDALVDALKEERFRRTGRFLLCLPKGIGRVRLSSVEDDLLLEHATAWCAAHAGE